VRGTAVPSRKRELGHSLDAAAFDQQPLCGINATTRSGETAPQRVAPASRERLQPGRVALALSCTMRNTRPADGRGVELSLLDMVLQIKGGDASWITPR
jgi:hypothetical protein